MSLKQVGKLIREARTKAGLTQEQLAKKIKGVSAADISKAERGEKGLTADQLKAVAKATGVTQKSLLDAAKGTASGSSSSSSSSSSSKKTGTLKLTATEKKLVELYRKADSATKKSVMETLEKGEDSGGLLGGLADSASSAVGGLLGGLAGNSDQSGNGGILGSLLSGAANLFGSREMPEGDERGKDEK